MLSALAASPSPHKVHFYCSSGGNAGLACVTAAIALNRPATVVVPIATSALMVEKLKGLGADVRQVGAYWTEADTFLREELLGRDENGVYVPPFDHPDVWDGHATLVEEVEEQMAQLSVSMDALVCSVGGGGLFAGIMQGLERNRRLEGANGVRILATETQGAHSLNYSLQMGGLSRLDQITSIATSLGATQVARRAYDYAIRYRGQVKSCVLSDAEAAMACVAFAEDERMIVESACGVSLAAVYDGSLQEVLYPELSDAEFEQKSVVIVVCGGSNISLEMLEKYKQTYGKDEAVLSKFHQRYRKSLKGKQTVPIKLQEQGKEEGVPFIAHRESRHALPEVVPECDEAKPVRMHAMGHD